jgi:hypothetical protein
MHGSSAAGVLSLSLKSDLNLVVCSADSEAMKIKRIAKHRAAEVEAVEPLKSVQAFLSFSGAARNPLESAPIRERVVQDPLGALRERLAAG